MSRDEFRNEARFQMYDDDDSHQSLFEAFVSHTAKDLGPIDQDWFAKERDSQISECSGFLSSSNPSSNPCTPIVSPCLSRDDGETPRSGASTPKSAASCQRNASMLDWTPLSPVPAGPNLFKTPGLPKSFPQSLGVNTATPSPHWSPSLETPPNQRTRAKGDGKVLAPKNLFRLPTKDRQSVSSEVEDFLEDEEFKDVLSDGEEHSGLNPDGSSKEDFNASRTSGPQKPPRGDSHFAPKAASPIRCRDGSLLAPQHCQSATRSAGDIGEATPKRSFTPQEPQLSTNSAKMRKNQHSSPNAVVIEAEKLAVAGKRPTVASDRNASKPVIACQSSPLLSTRSRVENAADVLPKTVDKTPSRESSSRDESFSSVSKDFSFVEDKSDCDFGRADLSLTQMFEVAESTIACLEATDVGFTQCTSSSSEVHSDHVGIATKRGRARGLREDTKLNSEQLMSVSNFDDSSVAVLPKLNGGSSHSLTTNLVGKDCRFSTGFKTGSGKPVVVLESSLSTAKRMLMADEASDSDVKKEQPTSSVRRPIEHRNLKSLHEPLGTGHVGNTAAQSINMPEQGADSETHTSEWNSPHPKSNLMVNGHWDYEMNDGNAHDTRPKVTPRACAAENADKVLTGFKTASGAAVSVLKSSVLFAKNSLASCTEGEGGAQDACDSPRTAAGFTTADGRRHQAVPTEHQTQAPSLISFGCAKPSVLESGFTTAGGKPVYVQEEGLIRARQLLSKATAEAGNDEAEGKATPTRSMGESVNVSVDPLKKLPAPQSASVSGFATASGKPVYIQEGALNRARKLLSEAPALADEKTAPKVFMTGSGKQVDASIDSFNKSKASQGAFTSSFVTAGGKPVLIQEGALDQAHQLLSEAPANADETVPTFFSMGPGKKVDASVDALNKSKTAHRAFTSSFATAGGKPVLIQEGALNQARQLLSEAPADTDKTVPTFFTTGSGKKVGVLVDSLNRSKAAQGAFTSSFATAGGKPVLIQEGALDQARQLLCEAPAHTDETAPTFFTTGSGKKVDISVDALKKSKALASGFMTAGGKSVFIQEEGLTRAHQLFSDTTAGISDNLPQPKTVGTFFSTGSGKIVEVSADSLKKSKELLGETNNTSPPAIHLHPHFAAESKDGAHTSFTAGLEQAVSVSKNSAAPENDNKKEVAALTSKQENAQPGVKQYTPTAGKARPSPNVSASSAASDKRTPVGGLSRLGHTPSPMFASKLRPGVRTPSFVTPFKTVGFGKAATPVAPRGAVGGPPRSLFQRKAVQPGKLWILRKVTKGPRLSLKDALQGERPKFYSLEELKGYGVLDSTTTITSENAADFVFRVSASDSLLILGDGATVQLSSSEVMLGREEFYRAFLSMRGVDGKLVSESWLDNHYRWVVWKLASMELHCPQVFGGRSLTPDQVMLQLKYRYDIEIDHSSRSALRKIYERDDIPSKSLVLCVSAVMVKEGGAMQVELTDGWYGIRAELDEPLSELVSTGRIFVGLKILTSGAELVGSSEACPPLEAPPDAALKLSYNSTRRACWDTRLGYFVVPRPFRVSLSSLHPKGGLVGRVDCLVIRAYPIMYLEMLPNGMGVMRNEAEERVIAAKHEKLRSAFTEKLTAEVLSQVEKTDTEELSLSGIQMSYSVKQIQGLSSGRDIWKAMRNSSDPLEIERILTEEQVHLLRRFQEEQLCRRQADIQQKLESALQAAVEENKCPKERVVIPVLKVLVGGIHEEDLRKNICCLLCVWRPTDDTRETLKQGRALSLYNVNVTAPRQVLPDVQNSAVELSTTKTTQFEPVDCPDHIRIYYMRQVTSFPVLLTESGSQGRAVDIVGCVVRVSPHKEGTVLTLADAKLNFVHLVANKKALPAGDSIEKGQFLSATDVTLRTGSGERMATLETTEFSLVTSAPSGGDLQRALLALKASIPDPTGFVVAALARLQAPARVLSPAVQRPQCTTPVISRPARFATPNGTALARTPCAATRATPKQSAAADLDGLVLPKQPIAVEPGSPAEALQKQVRSRIALLERYAALEPIPCFTTTPSPKAATPYQRPKMVAPQVRARKSPPEVTPPMELE
ncbi:uncharacterized protein LOC144174396 isoform X2 [Haemaphysalis longicornis]